VQDLAAFRENPEEQHLTTDQGLRINDDQNSLKAGERGSLLEDDETIFATNPTKKPKTIHMRTVMSPPAFAM